MPPRVSRPAEGPSKAKPQGAAKHRSRKRVLNAFAIASHEVTDSTKVRKSRLGQAEEDPRDRKRRRVNAEDDDEEEDSEDEGGASTKRQKSRRTNAGDSDGGSDSEGNTWTLGHVDAEDDSDIDSDGAFEEGDEERFAHFTFRGSKRNKPQGKGQSSKRMVQSKSGHGLDEDVEAEDSDDSSLGEDAIDLAQMLDDYSDDEGMDEDRAGSDQEENRSGATGAPDTSVNSESSGSSDDEDDDRFSESSFGEEDEQDPSKLGKLQNLVSSLHPKSAQEKQHAVSSYESMTPSAAGILNSEKFDIRDILESTGDAQLAKMSKSVGTIPSKTMKKDPKLAPSLPKRQKEKLDRIAANEKAKETLDRWTDSVKQMRRAEHLTFPLQEPGTKAAHDTGYLLPSITTQPVTDLESTITNILRESGLAVDEPAEDAYDELPENKASLQEILAKRAELRKARDLIFREEQRSKRVKKIKSKSYRRVHRKERERAQAAQDKDAFETDFVGEMDEDEREEHDRKRAHERMGAKHRDSKWAKQMKKSGRSIWDDDARSGVTEMARRNEELRRRMAGKDTNDDNDGSSSSDDEEAPSDEEEPTFQLRQLRKKLAKLKEDGPDEEQESGLAGMMFMKRAEASRKKQNEEDINRMVKEMNGEDSEDDSSVDDAETIGRKLFGPASKKAAAPARPTQQRNEFEELEDSAAEDDGFEFDSMPVIDPTMTLQDMSKVASRTASIKKAANGQTSSASEKQSQITKRLDKETIPGEKLSAPDAEGWVTVSYDKSSDVDSDVESEVSEAEIMRKGFAGDDVEEIFEKEKKATIADEDEKIVDKTVPGWGSWIGDGVSKRELKKNKGKVMVKQAGIRPQDRKDAKLKGVIMSTKRLKKNLGYMANALPFPFTSQAEYDRSIRMPIGKEWNVKKTYGENTKPRIIVKPGQVVLPMEKPLI
jgi:U3 small nucleolar RNA-associated protein 14